MAVPIHLDGQEAPTPIDPDVALIGPMSSGKTIFRMYLANANANYPLHIRSALRCDRLTPEEGLKCYLLSSIEGGKRMATSIADSEWKRSSEPLDNNQNYYVKVHGTVQPTLHPIPFYQPNGAQDKSSYVWMIDYPGEYFMMSRDQETMKEDLAYLDRCSVVMFMVPFWLLIPHPWRAESPWYLPPAEAAHLKVRISALMNSFDRWQKLLLHRPRQLLIGLTMLSEDWHGWINDACPAELAHLIARIRRLITHPALDPQRAQPMVPFAESLIGLYRASEARVLLHRLHRLCSELVAFETPQEDLAVAGLRSRLRELSSNMGEGNVRYFAFNIVSERHRLHVPNSDIPDKLREEPAGLSIPCLYLSSLLFDLM